MCAMRHYRSVPPVSLANQYRLDQKPKRPQPRKLFRPKKAGENAQQEPDTEDENKIIIEYDHGYMYSHIDDFDEFDFDAEDDFYDMPPLNCDLTQRYYVQACEELHVMPVKCIYEGLVEVSMVCRGATLQQNDTKALTIALVSNSRCETIDFSNNNVGPVGGGYFGDLLSRNLYLTDVTITWNRLGSLGAETICRALTKNNTVKKLDLTGNCFKETDAPFFKELLEENCGIVELFLGHNYFRERGGEILALGISQNDVITNLDLSWNHLRLKGAMAIAVALEKNLGIEILNISWNGFHKDGLAYIGQALARNSTLLEIDIACNRIMDICLPNFLKGLQKNTTLKSLKLSKNHISNDGAMTILTLLKECPNMALDYIDFGDQPVKEDFVDLLEELKKTKEINVGFGSVWSKKRDPLGKEDQTEDEIALLNENPHFVLMEFMRLQKLRLIDLFHQMDKDQSKGISVDEFKLGLEAVDIPLKRTTLAKFVKKCDTNKNGEIDFSELLEANKLYKDYLRKSVKNNEPIEMTPIGRIQKLLRKIMINNGSLRFCKPPPQITH